MGHHSSIIMIHEISKYQCMLPSLNWFHRPWHDVMLCDTMLSYDVSTNMYFHEIKVSFWRIASAPFCQLIRSIKCSWISQQNCKTPSFKIGHYSNRNILNRVKIAEILSSQVRYSWRVSLISSWIVGGFYFWMLSHKGARYQLVAGRILGQRAVLLLAS